MSAASRELSAGAKFPRQVLPELLDALPADDPRAIRSRRDLRLVNRIMGAKPALLRGLDAAGRVAPRHIVELGAGDGSMALRIARSRARAWPEVSLTLLDLKPVVGGKTLAAIRGLGWKVDVVAADALDWLAQPAAADSVVFANLFVHHFDGARLEGLLAGIAAHARMFVCYEPRRSRVALTGSRLLGLIGCNDVTRHDAVLSVRAGFRDDEVSRAWRAGEPGGWTLRESPAAPFGHLFAASRNA